MKSLTEDRETLAHLIHVLLDTGPVRANRRPQAQVLGHGEPGEDTPSLRNHPDPPPDDFLRSLAEEGLSLEPDLASGRSHYSGDSGKHSGLPSPICTDEAHHLAFLHPD